MFDVSGGIFWTFWRCVSRNLTLLIHLPHKAMTRTHWKAMRFMLMAVDYASLNPAPAGLSFGDRNSVNLLIQADVNLPNGIGGSLRFMPELAGSGEDSEAVDQLIANLLNEL